MKNRKRRLLNDRHHPCPLPQEREFRLPRSGETMSSGNSVVLSCESSAIGVAPHDSLVIGILRMLFPIPGGAGQGEGERHN